MKDLKENMTNVPGGGIEPPQPNGYWFLRPTRLPVPPSRLELQTIKKSLYILI